MHPQLAATSETVSAGKGRYFIVPTAKYSDSKKYAVSGQF